MVLVNTLPSLRCMLLCQISPPTASFFLTKFSAEEESWISAGVNGGESSQEWEEFLLISQNRKTPNTRLPHTFNEVDTHKWTYAHMHTTTSKGKIYFTIQAVLWSKLLFCVWKLCKVIADIHLTCPRVLWQFWSQLYLSNSGGDTPSDYKELSNIVINSAKDLETYATWRMSIVYKLYHMHRDIPFPQSSHTCEKPHRVKEFNFGCYPRIICSYINLSHPTSEFAPKFSSLKASLH